MGSSYSEPWHPQMVKQQTETDFAFRSCVTAISLLDFHCENISEQLSRHRELDMGHPRLELPHKVSSLGLRGFKVHYRVFPQQSYKHQISRRFSCPQIPPICPGKAQSYLGITELEHSMEDLTPMVDRLLTSYFLSTFPSFGTCSKKYQPECSS